MPHTRPVGENIAWLKEHCFNDPERRIRLERGHRLLRPGQANRRLFLVLEGCLVGTIEHAGGNRFEIFRAGPDALVGAYSFFSEKHQSYSQVAVEEPSEVAYIEKHSFDSPELDYGEFARRILPVVVDEIYSRQLLAHRISIEKQEAMIRLLRAEKLATLGQMAAGLAHELNNALGVIQKKTYWLIDLIAGYFEREGTGHMYPMFQQGLKKGQDISTAEVRRLRRQLEGAFNLKPAEAREWARMGLSPQAIKKLGFDLQGEASERTKTSFEAGLALHDLALAADHVVNVIQSVHDLGVVHRSHPRPIDLNATLREAFALLKGLTEKIDVQLQLYELPTLIGNSGDWVQVWVNLVKNGCEAMLNGNTENPRIEVATRSENGRIEVRIIDNGPGIPEALQSKIFQPSFTTKKGGMTFGLGLGLTIVQRIVESYNGSIHVDSRPGHTCFTVEIEAQ